MNCIYRLFFCCLLSLTLLLPGSPAYADTRPATAFYYAAHLPLELLSTYQRVVVEPDNVTSAELQFLKQHGVTVYAYFSLGEVGPDRPWLAEIAAEWILGTNPGWNSKVMDMTQTGWHTYVMAKKLRVLKDRGFDNFFLDTLDSYQLFAKTPEAQQKQQRGVVELLRAIKQQYPDARLLFNRGFEIIDQVATLCDGIVAESLFKGWDPGKSAYKDVNENDRTWLLTKLRTIHERYQLPITVLDYLPPNERAEAEKVADKIKALGFIPWISTPALDYMGVGELNLVPRKVLLLYDSNENLLRFNNVHRLLATPLEYLGYIPEYQDIRTSLPDFTLQGRYAGIVSWLSSNTQGNETSFSTWMRKQLQDNVKVVFMNTFPFMNNAELQQTLNLDASTVSLPEPIQLDILSKHVGYETQPLKRRLDLLTIAPKGKRDTWLRVSSTANAISEPVYTTSWGGMALSPYVLFEMPNNQHPDESISRWIINPFEFLKQALQLQDLPVADNTTENGRRILTLHIDGDGFYNQSEVHTPSYSGDVILQEFLRPSQLPHTVSIIEGEIGPQGLKPELSTDLENIARTIFNLPQVEIASHSYSHPFDWLKASEVAKQPLTTHVGSAAQVGAEKKYTLPIPNYTYSAEREITGSINYINTRLAPAHKKAQVFLWTGDALPDEEAINLAEQLPVAHMNGGTTMTHNGLLSLANISPSGIVRGAYFQPYAPIQSENSLTHDWHGPYYGYQDVINTFKLTDTPKRLKPIAVYYHFYSGDKTASVAALKRVYAWVQSQETLALWISEYTPRLYAFRQAVYEKRPHGWKIYHAQNLKTLRLGKNHPPPNLSLSQGIAGYKYLPQGVYLSLTGQDEIYLDTQPEGQGLPYLDNSNAPIRTWKNDGAHIIFSLKGHQPVTLALGNFAPHCSLRSAEHKLLTGISQNAVHLFNFETSDTGELHLSCEKS